MRNRLAGGAAPILVWAAFATSAAAQGPEATTPATPPGVQCVRARDLATAEEFAAHQARIRAAETPEARAKEMAAFMDQMRQRAEARDQKLCREVMGGPGRGPGGMGGGPGMGRGPGGPGGPGGGPGPGMAPGSPPAAPPTPPTPPATPPATPPEVPPVVPDPPLPPPRPPSGGTPQ
jgi:hypothetical protein